MSSQTTLLGRIRHVGASDETLLDRARQGDTQAFEHLYRRSYDSVFGFCLLRLRSRQAAEDAAQEVFIRAADATGAPVTDVRAWLLTIARNVVIDAGRRAKARPAPSPLLAEDIDAIGGAGDATALSALDVPANVFIALRRLKTRERTALIEREFQDRSSRQIADGLGMTPGAVDVLISRARASFATAYRQVAEMPFACRQTTELVYRELGSGLTERQCQMMETHLKHCPRCTLEHRMARAPKMLGGLLGLPWLQQAAEALTHSRLAGLSLPAKAAVGAVAVTLAVAPAVIGTTGAGLDIGAGERREITVPAQRLQAPAGGARTGSRVAVGGEAPGRDADSEVHVGVEGMHMESAGSHLEPTSMHREPTGSHDSGGTPHDATTDTVHHTTESGSHMVPSADSDAAEAMPHASEPTHDPDAEHTDDTAHR